MAPFAVVVVVVVVDVVGVTAESELHRSAPASEHPHSGVQSVQCSPQLIPATLDSAVLTG